jgi:hypothetical protein
MNENIEYSKLIDLVIDGEASEIERQTFFAEIGTNPSLQTEFQSALKINSAARNFASTSEVPKALTMGLFSKAGLSYAGASAGASLVGSGFASKYGGWILGKYAFGLLGIILGGIAMFLLLNEVNKSNIVQLNNRIIQAEQQTQTLKSELALLQLHNENISSQPTRDMQIIAKQDKIPVTNSQAIVPATIEQEKFTKEQDNSILPKNIKLLTNISETLNILSTKPVFTDELTHNLPIAHNTVSTNLLSSKDNRFALEVKNSTFWNLPHETVYPSEISKLHNMDIVLFYKLNDFIALGLGARQETFYVKYNSIDEYNQEFIFEQQPNITSYELSARFTPFEIYNISPFLQLSTGGGHYGYTLRAALGSEINLYSNLALVFALDYATLQYKHHDNWNTANKIGINYGILYRF